MSENTNTNDKPAMTAYSVQEGNNNKSYWHKVGVAWENSKGGYNVKLFATPVNGEIVLMPPRDNEEQ